MTSVESDCARRGLSARAWEKEERERKERERKERERKERERERERERGTLVECLTMSLMAAAPPS